MPGPPGVPPGLVRVAEPPGCRAGLSTRCAAFLLRACALCFGRAGTQNKRRPRKREGRGKKQEMCARPFKPRQSVPHYG